MAASLPENWACINGDGEFDTFELPEFDSALLMSLLEESQGEECDDERLTSLIRSLEAEIDPNMFMDGHDLHLEGYQSSHSGQVDGQDWSSSIDLNFNWMAVEMAPSSPSDDMMNSWYMDPCGDEMDGIIEFGGGVSDYSQIYYGVPLEEPAYGSLWARNT